MRKREEWEDVHGLEDAKPIAPARARTNLVDG